MTTQTTLAAALLIAASLAVVGIWLMRMVLTEPEPSDDQRAETADMLDYIRDIGSPPPGSVPCMEVRLVGSPLICGRANEHVGHHIAFGIGHRIMASWPQTPNVVRLPVQRRAGEGS